MKKYDKKVYETVFAVFANCPIAWLAGYGAGMLYKNAKTLTGKVGVLALTLGAFGSMNWLQKKGIEKVCEETVDAFEEDEESYSFIDFEKVHKVES